MLLFAVLKSAVPIFTAAITPIYTDLNFPAIKVTAPIAMEREPTPINKPLTAKPTFAIVSVTFGFACIQPDILPVISFIFSIPRFIAGIKAVPNCIVIPFTVLPTRAKSSLNFSLALAASSLIIRPILSASLPHASSPSLPEFNNGINLAPVLPKSSIASAAFSGPSSTRAKISDNSDKTSLGARSFPSWSFSFIPKSVKTLAAVFEPLDASIIFLFSFPKAPVNAVSSTADILAA